MLKAATWCSRLVHLHVLFSLSDTPQTQNRNIFPAFKYWWNVHISLRKCSCSFRISRASQFQRRLNVSIQVKPSWACDLYVFQTLPSLPFITSIKIWSMFWCYCCRSCVSVMCANANTFICFSCHLTMFFFFIGHIPSVFICLGWKSTDLNCVCFDLTKIFI